MAHLLVIDDDVQMRDLLAIFLAAAGHEVAVAADGSAALGVLRTMPIALVITDLLMPNQDGIELIQWLRRERPAVAIIAMSGHSSLSSPALSAARCLGAKQVLTKPFALEELRRAIDAVLAKRPGEELARECSSLPRG